MQQCQNILFQTVLNGKRIRQMFAFAHSAVGFAETHFY